jgi:hypothetical protein
MPPLDRLFLLELEYHRLLRNAPDTPEAVAPHISYAMANGYKSLLRSLGPVSVEAVDRVYNRLLGYGDARDVIRARDSIKTLLRLWPESR